MSDQAPPIHTEHYISTLSRGLIEHALCCLQKEALPAYLKNSFQRSPPIAINENVPSAIATLLLLTGVDYHLARLKYLRDIGPDQPPPSNKPLNWKMGDSLATKVEGLLAEPGKEGLKSHLLEMGDSLSAKIEGLLTEQDEEDLKSHLVEMTLMRNYVAHSQIYEEDRATLSDDYTTEVTAKLPTGSIHRAKTLCHKDKNSEYTGLLRLPLVPTWISYPDVVACVCVLDRLQSLLVDRYGEHLGGMTRFVVPSVPETNFFPGITTGSHTVTLREWAEAFFYSLTPDCQSKLRIRVKVNFPEDRPPVSMVVKTRAELYQSN